MHEISSTKIVLDVQTHLKPTESFQYALFSSCHPVGVKKRFHKRRRFVFTENKVSQRNLRVTKVCISDSTCRARLPRELAEKILTKVNFSSRIEALRNKIAKYNSVLPFVTTFNPATPNLETILMKY